MSRSVVKRCLKPLLFLVCLLLLAWMVWQAGPQQLWQTLCTLPGTIALCVLVWGVGYLLNAASFRQVLVGMVSQQPIASSRADSAASADEVPARVPHFWRMLQVTIGGYALNYITPFGLLGGEPYRVYLLRDALGTERATQGVVLYSMMHVASHFCFWLISAVVAMALALQPAQRTTQVGWAEILTIAALVLICLSLLWLFWRLYRRGIALRFMRRWVDWPLLNPSLLPAAHFARALGLELASRLVNVIEYWLIMQALGYPQFGYAQALLVVAFSSLLANILFFSPLQMGTREGGILLALQYLLSGTLLPVALTLSFATRIREFIWIGIGLTFIKRK